MLDIFALEQEIAAAMQAAHVPGVALAVVHQHRLIYAHGFGVTSVETRQPVTTDTLFRIGSTTKPLTTIMVMQLVEEGLLDLDAPLSDLLPDLTLSDPHAASRITPRLLLAHRAGLPTAAEHHGSREAAGLREAIYRDIGAYPLLAEPGRIWSYSNPGINIVGHLAEQATGKDYTTLMQERVFTPLYMHHTTFDPLVAMTYPLAQSHTLDADGRLVVEHHYADNSAHYPAGFAISTVLDMANVARMLLADGQFEGRQLLNAASVAQMKTPQAQFPTFDQDGYGLTLTCWRHRGVQLVGHGGRISQFASDFTLAPETGTAVILLANHAAQWEPHETRLTQRVLGMLVSFTEPSIPVLTEPHRTHWDALTGLYVGGNHGMAQVSVSDDHLIMEWQGEKLPLHRREGLSYAVKMPDETWMPLQFDRQGDQAADYLTLLERPGSGLSLKRLETDDTPLPHADLAPLVGTYRSPLTHFTVTRDTDTLSIASPLLGNTTFALRSIGGMRFIFPFGLLTFEAPDTLRLGAGLLFVRDT